MAIKWVCPNCGEDVVKSKAFRASEMVTVYVCVSCLREWSFGQLKQKPMSAVGAVLAMLIILIFAIPGCTGKSEDELKIAKAAADFNAPIEAQKKKEAEEMLKKEAQEKKGAIEAKKATLEKLKEAFGTSEKEPGWIKEVQGADKSLKGLQNAYNNLSAGVHVMQKEAVDISWQEVGITEEKARKMMKDVGLDYAKKLLETFNLSWDARRTVTGRGEGSFMLYESSSVLVEIVDVLRSIGAEPIDIGSSPKALRDTLANDLKKNHIPLYRSSKSADEKGSMWGVINESVRHWNISPQELKLTPKETEELDKEGS